MELPIDFVKVDIPLADVKSELGAEFIPRTSQLIAFGSGRLEQINQEIMGGPPNTQCKNMWRDDRMVKTLVSGFQYILEPGEVY